MQADLLLAEYAVRMLHDFAIPLLKLLHFLAVDAHLSQLLQLITLELCQGTIDIQESMNKPAVKKLEG